MSVAPYTRQSMFYQIRVKIWLLRKFVDPTTINTAVRCLIIWIWALTISAMNHFWIISIGKAKHTIVISELFNYQMELSSHITSLNITYSPSLGMYFPSIQDSPFGLTSFFHMGTISFKRSIPYRAASKIPVSR